MKAKSIIKRMIHRMGFELKRLNPNSNPAYQLLKGFERFGINQVFDIGANTGQFATELRSVGYKGGIISFEPILEAHQNLSNAAMRDPYWIVHQRGAIGDYDGEIEINISGNSVSSSVLPMMESHSSAAVDSAYIDTQKVPIARLDSIASDYLSDSSRTFIKIDTQGFEWEVIDGALKILPQVQGMMCELSIVPLYERQHLWLDMIKRIESEGFTIWSVQQGFRDPRDGRTLQLDVTFFRI